MSKLALKLIAENKKTRATYLDLGNCGLSELPPALGKLVWLECLILSSNWVVWEGNDYESHSSKNTGKNNRALKDITLLKKLPRLQVLVANDTQVSDLAPLSDLCALQTLDLNITQVSDLAPLAGLYALRTLDLNRTQASDLAPLSGLRALRLLWINSTQVSNLAPLLHLIELDRVVSIKPFGGNISVFDCPLISPPVEIVAQGNTAILNYFRERNGGRCGSFV